MSMAKLAPPVPLMVTSLSGWNVRTESLKSNVCPSITNFVEAIEVLTHALHDLDAGVRSRAPDVRTERDTRVVAMIVVGPENVDDC